ncbi:hypothetical protein Ancab_004616, partial [Ancistrocladus abbreviatus]
LGLFRRLQTEIVSITDELGSVRVLLKDAEEKAEVDNEVEEWVRQVRNVTYRIEDVIDEYKKQLLDRPHNSHCCILPFKKAARWVIEWKEYHRIASSIKEIKVEVTEIIKRKDNYELPTSSQAGRSRGQPSNWQDPRACFLYTEKSQLVGIEARKGDLMQILNLENHELPLSVISVVGMGGLGKTTIVKQVYEDALVKDNFFPYRAWITVTRSYSREDIFRATLKQLYKASKEPPPLGVDAMEEESLIDELRNCVLQKR